jgi:RNA polymerase sigma factor (sigma-70 family)
MRERPVNFATAGDRPTPTDRLSGIVARHVDLVYSTALRLVGDPHLAEDVGQAAFVALARKIDRVDDRTVAGWLVNATRLAAKEAMRARSVRQRNENSAASLRRETIRPADDATADDLLALLDQALSQLNEADRTAVAIRFLEGRSFEQVGTVLGSTEEAARKRVVRAVEKMRRFFLDQGIKTGVGGLTVILAAQQATEAPAAVTAAATGGASPAAVKFAQGVLTMMKWTRIKIGLVAVMVLIAVASGVYGLDVLTTPPAAQIAATAPAAPAAAPSPADDLARLRKERIDLLTQALEESKQMFAQGIGDFAAVRRCERELLDARLEAAATPAARRQVLTEMLALAKAQEQMSQSRFKAGLSSHVEAAESTADRLQVEILLAKDRAAARG